MALHLVELSRRSKRLAPTSKPVLARVVVEVLEDRTLPSVTVGVSVDGMNTTNNSCACQPPDTIAAAGPNHIVHMVNTAIEIFNKDGSVAVAPQSLLTFFSNHVNANQSDPFVVYDEAAGKFVVGILDFPATGAGFTDLATGVDSPSGITWTLAAPLPDGDGNNFTDYPRVGWNADAIFISYNMFGNSFAHVQTVTLDTNLNLISRHFDTTGLFTLTPAVMHGSVSGGPEYFVEANNSGGSALDVTTETNVLSSTPTFTNASVSVPSYSNGGSAPQGVAAFDDRIFNVAYRTVNGVGHLVAAHQVAGGKGKGGGPVARWYDINAGTDTLIQSGNAPAGVNGAATFMPSVDINTAGSIGMTFGESAKKEFWSMYVAERTASDPAGTMQAAVKVASGVAKSLDSRVGDFSGTTVDPSDGLTFWSANEYQGTDFWDTHIASFSIAGAVHTPPAVSTVTIGVPSAQVTVPDVMASLVLSELDRGASSINLGQPAFFLSAQRDAFGQLVVTSPAASSVSSTAALVSRAMDTFWSDLFNTGLQYLGI
jgi:hypothetical protein